MTPLHIILGPTCSGKNALAQHLAPRLNAEIISVDSMKIYKGMDIGTAKSADHPALMRDKPSVSERTKVIYHLIDIIDPCEPYSVAQFVSDAESAMDRIRRCGRMPLLAAGTPMYLKALLYGIFSGLSTDTNLRQQLETRADGKGLELLYQELKSIDPAKAKQLHPHDRKRIIRAHEVYTLTGQTISSLQTHFKKTSLRYPVKIIGLNRDRAELYERINKRVIRMFDDGLVDEVQGLLRSVSGVPNEASGRTGLSVQARQAVGYKEVISYLNKESTLPQAIELVQRNSRHFARRQLSWFRKFPEVKWLDLKSDSRVETIAKKVLAEWGL